MGVAVLSAHAPVLLLAALFAAAPALAEPALPVRRVVVRSEARLDPRELTSLVAIRSGAPLDRESVRRTLRNLRLSGLASEVEVLTTPLGDGVEVSIVLRADLQVTRLAIDGDTGLSPEKLRARLPQRAGQPLREDRLLRGVYALQDALADEGWLAASVHLDVAPQPDRRSVEVTYRVEAGRRTRVGAISFEGAGDQRPADLAAALRSRPGEPFRRLIVRDDAERLTRFLVRRGFRQCRVEPARQTPADDGTIALAFRAELGPPFDFELVGGDQKSLAKRGLLPFLDEDGYDEALLLQSLGQIKRDYQEKGHYRVEVRETHRLQNGRFKVRIEIVPGERYGLDEIRFEGNDSFPASRLTALLATAPRRRMLLASGRLVDDELGEDLANLRSFYALAGFDRVQIDAPRVEEPRPRHLRLTIPIREGTRRTTGTIEIVGLHALGVEQAKAKLPLVAGGPYHRLLVESSIETLRDLLEKAGYRSALVDAQPAWNADQTVADVRFDVLEGERSVVEVVLVRGNSRTPTPLVRRFVDLRPGDPISSDAMLDVQRSLYRLGIFSRVDVRLPATDSEFAASEVLVEVEEGKSRGIAYGAGYDTEAGARGLLRYSHSNLWGRAASFQLDALVAQRDYLYRGVFQQPYLGRWPVQLKATLYRQKETRPTFDDSKRGAQIAFERTFGHLRVGLFAEYRIVDLNTDEPEEVIPRESRNARVASVSPTLLWDRRDDPLDPSRGWSASMQLEHASPVGDATADFDKLFAQLTDYLHLLGGTFAFSLRGGWLIPHGSGEGDLEPIDLVPVAELFFAGGRTTHRAYARDELGIPGQTLHIDPGQAPVPLGGGALALLNAEYRFPLVGALSGELFVDGGNVWREMADFSAADVKWGAGVGLRYGSPVGPLRVEVGWKLDREPYEDPYVWFVSLGNTF